MWDWVITYWVQVLFGLIAAGFGFLAKKFWTMYQNEKVHDVEANMAACYERVKGEIQEVESMVLKQEDLFENKITKAYNNAREHDKNIENNIDSMSKYINVLKDGVLSIQGAHFRQQCKTLLQDETHFISIDEFEQLTFDHNIYNQLGGNHLGDALFATVEARFKAQQLSMGGKDKKAGDL